MNRNDAANAADAAARVRAAGGTELVERLLHLDGVRREKVFSAPSTHDKELRAPDEGAHVDFDVVIAGGGLSLLLAPALASLGVRVGVFDRARAGGVHREWNASGKELTALVSGGIVSASELDALTVARYRHGSCRFHGHPARVVRGVLDHAVDAGGLLDVTRRAAIARGAELFDGHTLVGVGPGAHAVALRFQTSATQHRDVIARIFVDARGASSPHATADMICPTVGGVVRGLAEGGADDEIDPTVGEILATIDGAEGGRGRGRQHVWEAFPGRSGETTVYLFYYANADSHDSLLSLYARFFDQLAHYKRGDATLARPTFGYIPGWSRLTPAPRPPHPRIVLVGDAAARHSPLTLCGFGATLRAFTPVAGAIAAAVADVADAKGRSAIRLLAPRIAAAQDSPVHALTGALAKIMAEPPRSADSLNALLDAAFSTLEELGNDAYAALLQDEMRPRAFVDFLRRTAEKRPSVYREAFSALGAKAIARWGVNVARGALVA